MQGWLAQLQGDLSGSLISYQLSLSLWQRRHGEEHASTVWGYILVGTIKAEQGQTASALADMQRGLAILDRTLGRQIRVTCRLTSPYLRLLERTEAHAEAARLKTTAEQELRTFYRDQCSDCTRALFRRAGRHARPRFEPFGFLDERKQFRIAAPSKSFVVRFFR
jgi:Tetratricopeptide repeat